MLSLRRKLGQGVFLKFESGEQIRIFLDGKRYNGKQYYYFKIDCPDSVRILRSELDEIEQSGKEQLQYGY